MKIQTESRALPGALLREMRRLNSVSARLWRIHDLNEGLTEILRGAIALLRADFGNVQLYDSDARVLRIAVQLGFDRRFLDHFREVSTVDNAACGRALRAGRRTIIEDVEKDPGFTPHRAVARHSGFRAVQSTPLVARDGRPLGMISTHFRTPQRPDALALEQLDLYARQAASFIERCRAERAVRDAEASLRLSLSAAGAGTWSWNAKTGRVSWDDRFHALYGLKRQHQRTFRTWLGRIHEEDRPRLLATIAKLRRHRTRRSWDIEFRSEHPNGAVVWHHGLGEAIRDERGRLQGLRGLDTDITARRLSTKTLEESEFRLRAAQNVARIGSWEWDLLTDRTWWDPEIYVMHGMQQRAKPFTPADLLRRVHPEDRARVQTAIAAAVSTGKAADLEYRASHPDGTIRFIHAVGAVIQFDPRGRPLKMVGINHDVTTQREAEAALRRTIAELVGVNTRLRALLDTALVGIVTLDERGIILAANRGLREMLGYAAGEIEGRRFATIVEGASKRPNRSITGPRRRAQKASSTAAGQEILARRKNGELFPVEMDRAPFSEAGLPFEAVVMRDVSERRRLETEVTRASEQAHHRLAAEIHDGLGQHLHAMKYLAEEQERRMVRAGSTEASGLRRQIQLIDQGIAQGRGIARGLRPLEDLPEGLMLGLKQLTAELNAIGKVQVRFACPRRVALKDHLVASHLFRIAQEAASNALRHGGCRRITLRLTGTATRVHISVEDDGRGLARDRPSGMGLKLMQYRADAIAGTLIVENAARGGTQVACTVVRKVPTPRDANPRPRPGRPVNRPSWDPGRS